MLVVCGGVVVCCGIKVLSVLTFLLDWYLIRRRESSEKKQTAMTVGEVVNSIISLDKRKCLPISGLKVKWPSFRCNKSIKES